MRTWPKLLAVAIAVMVQGCAAGSEGFADATLETAPVVADKPLTILVAIDGFRPDYLGRGITPNLNRLAEGGALGSMRPSFPSVTLPNFHTIMTGKVPDNHGIVGNAFEREDGVPFGEEWTDHSWWAAALPIWASIEAEGRGTGHFFYVPIGTDGHGENPKKLVRYDGEIAPADEPELLLQWMDVPQAEQPEFVSLYFYPVDNMGHRHGPHSPEVNEAIAEVDIAMGNLLAELERRGLRDRTNLVVVSDHGMAEIPEGQYIIVDDLVPIDQVRPISTGPYAAIEPAEGVSVESIADQLLRPHPHGECWRKEDLPERFRFGSNARIAPIVCLAAKGWSYVTREYLSEQAASGAAPTRGNHGYDPADPEMASLFIGNGFIFRQGTRLETFENTNVYFLLAELAGVVPENGDGSLDPFVPVLTGE